MVDYGLELSLVFATKPLFTKGYEKRYLLVFAAAIYPLHSEGCHITWAYWRNLA